MTEYLETEPGCEPHLYRVDMCCVHPCRILECPEPVCAIDFPSMRTFLLYKQIRIMLKQGLDITQAAEELCIKVEVAQRCWNKVRLLPVK